MTGAEAAATVVSSLEPSGSVAARLSFHQELGVDSGGGVSVPVLCAMLLGAFDLQWLPWNSFQKLTEGMEVCNVKNMVQKDAFCQEMPAQPQEHGKSPLQFKDRGMSGTTC